jgi:chemotaxis protein methyltransferase CheR
MYDLSHIYFEGVAPPKRQPARPLSGRCEVPPPRSEEAAAACMSPFIGWVLGQAQLEPSAYRASAMERRVAACLRALKVSTPEAACELIRHRPSALDRVLEALLIGTSGFFRDAPVFEDLQVRVLPELLRSRKGLRILSLGCARGQELYSVAMLLDEAGALGSSRLVGIDRRPRAIAEAADGQFSHHELEGIDPQRLARYFTVGGEGGFQVMRELRRQLDWRVGNVLALQDDSVWDIIFFRNLGIYMEREKVTRLWEDLSVRLMPAGYVVTGKAERAPETVGMRRLSHCIYQKIK